MAKHRLDDYGVSGIGQTLKNSIHLFTLARIELAPSELIAILRNCGYVGYSDQLQGTSTNAALCAARRRRALCDDASEKALEMGRQIFCVAHELISFQLDRLGFNAHADREGCHDSGCRVWRWPDDSEVGGCHAGHGVRRRLCQRQRSRLSSKKRATS